MIYGKRIYGEVEEVHVAQWALAGDTIAYILSLNSRSTGLVWELAANWRLLHSSDEPSELLIWLSHDDNTINIVLSIIIIIINFQPPLTVLS